jgi:hypothetical protein
MNSSILLLNGQGHEIFDFSFFFMNQFTQAPEYLIRAVSNISKIRGSLDSARCTNFGDLTPYLTYDLTIRLSTLYTM